MAERSGRVVVTGMGAVTAIGMTVPDFWAGLQAGTSGISKLEGGGMPQDELDDLKIKIAAQIKGFDPKPRLSHFKRDKFILHSDRYSWFAAAAASEAVAQSGLKTPFENASRAACITASSGHATIS